MSHVRRSLSSGATADPGILGVYLQASSDFLVPIFSLHIPEWPRSYDSPEE